MNLGDEQPMKLVMHFTFSSFWMAFLSESATNRVSSSPLPSGRKISTANWSLSANGNILIFSLGISRQLSRIMAIPPIIVTYGIRNVNPKTFSYRLCTVLVTAFPLVDILSGVIIFVSRNGISNTARNKDTIRLMVIVTGKSSRASWKAPVIVISSG